MNGSLEKLFVVAVIGVASLTTAARVYGRRQGGGEGGPPVTRRCEIVARAQELPGEIRETSGLALSRRSPGRLWTHNDGSAPELFALNEAGEVIGRVRLLEAAIEDWEDVEAGPCEDGDCLFVADIGDNDGKRPFVAVYAVPEPSPRSPPTRVTRSWRVRYPDGPRDAEGLFVLPSGEMFIVSKGRHTDVALYRVPPEGGREPAVLEKVRRLLPQPDDGDDRITAATATPDGHWVILRSHRSLYFYPAGALVSGEPVDPLIVDLRPLGEPQGEAAAVSNDGAVWLTSEAEDEKQFPRASRLDCRLPAGQP